LASVSIISTHRLYSIYLEVLDRSIKDLKQSSKYFYESPFV
jgi:hypothetical protein